MLEADTYESPPLSLTPNRGARWWLALSRSSFVPFVYIALVVLSNAAETRTFSPQAAADRFIWALNGTSDRFHWAEHGGKWFVNVDGPSIQQVWCFRGLMATPNASGQSWGVNLSCPPNRRSWNCEKIHTDAGTPTETPVLTTPSTSVTIRQQPSAKSGWSSDQSTARSQIFPSVSVWCFLMLSPF